MIRMFQSTPLYEGRLEQVHLHGFGDGVSIHAPVRGATLADAYRAAGLLFQSTPLYEGRPSVYVVGISSVVFQSTPLYEGRRERVTRIWGAVCFNPRPCTRGDRLACEIFCRLLQFQSTPLYEGRRRVTV